MTRFESFFSYCVLQVFVLGLVAAIANVTADDAAADDSAAAVQGPLLIAQLPAKPETKKYDLRYKLSRGDVLRYDVTHSASIHSTIDKTTQAAQTKTDSVKAWKVTDVLPEGEIEFMNVVERVHMINQLPDRKSAEYDSMRDKIAPPGFEDAAKAVGVPLSTVRMTPSGKIVHHQMKIHGQRAEEDTPIVVRLPEQPVAIGDTWDASFDLPVKQQKGVKTIQTRRHHKLTDVKDGIATIEVTYQVLSPVDAQIEVQLVERLMSGEVRFDIGAGRIVGQKMEVDKRILGFAGATSSMQYIMKMEEKLLKTEPKTAAKPKKPANTQAAKNKPTTNKNGAKTVNKRPWPKQPTQTASRPKTQTQQQPKTYRR